LNTARKINKQKNTYGEPNVTHTRQSRAKMSKIIHRYTNIYRKHLTIDYPTVAVNARLTKTDASREHVRHGTVICLLSFGNQWLPRGATWRRRFSRFTILSGPIDRAQLTHIISCSWARQTITGNVKCCRTRTRNGGERCLPFVVSPSRSTMVAIVRRRLFSSPPGRCTRVLSAELHELHR